MYEQSLSGVVGWGGSLGASHQVVVSIVNSMQRSGKVTRATAQPGCGSTPACLASWVDCPGGTPSCYFTSWVGVAGGSFCQPGRSTGEPSLCIWWLGRPLGSKAG
jgi:hypothetical protein